MGSDDDGLKSIGSVADEFREEEFEAIEENLITEDEIEEERERILTEQPFLPTKLREMNVPESYWDATRADFETDHYKNNDEPHLLDRIDAWDYEAGDWLLIHGPSRSGKSHFACYLAKAICVRQAHHIDNIDVLRRGNWEPEPYYQFTPKLMNHATDIVRGNVNDSITGIVESLAAKHLLILDDLGARSSNQTAINALHDLLSQREQTAENRPTIITTNLGPADIKDEYGQPVFMRIMNYAKTLNFDYGSRVDAEALEENKI